MHVEYHSKSSEKIRDFIIGLSDGLTVPFALAAGLSGAVDNTMIIITAGLAEIAAGSIAMGLGGYLSAKAEIEHYESEERREYDEVENKYEVEIQEVKDIVAYYGLDDEGQDKFAHALAKDKKKWVDFMMRFELGLEKPHQNRPYQSAFIIGVAYILGGIVPLMPYFFFSSVYQSLMYSCAGTLLFLFIFGLVKSKLTGAPMILGAIRLTLIGIAAATAAFGLAKLIS